MEQIRGGLLRWLWGLPSSIQIGIIAAYNNASYPLTLGPLESAPETAQTLEGILALLPYQDEVEDQVYGGLYCLSCVLDEAAKVKIFIDMIFYKNDLLNRMPMNIFCVILIIVYLSHIYRPYRLELFLHLQVQLSWLHVNLQLLKNM